MAHDERLAALLRHHHAFVATDDPFQRRARLLQALWREARGLPIGAKTSGDPIGSRIPLAFAKEFGADRRNGLYALHDPEQRGGDGSPDARGARRACIRRWRDGNWRSRRVLLQMK